ncbi:hypothetical protein [Candidatus Phytoplasma meliae]|uniref:Uncharacterized protein n=1 Tax=Candidatus Phytoplasma meliae TaxID=1848402 RepID=A0ABS5CYP1_9MOLU|nr:hypothetical protein [Candidatus Phytoplasma meliae]MBP5836095.1 hypothetical protein [Candidatus Phytoplasma meliae]
MIKKIINSVIFAIIGIVIGAVSGAILYIEALKNEPIYQVKKGVNNVNRTILQNSTIDKHSKPNAYEEMLHAWFNFINSLQNKNENN